MPRATSQRPRRDSAATTTPDSPMVSLQLAADRWSVSVDTIRRAVSTGAITGYRLNNRIIRVDLAEVDACFRPIPTVTSDR